MNASLDGGQVTRLLDYLQLMSHWNRAFNLTAVTEPMAMVERHLLDSLSIAPWLEADRIVDAGTGAGLPGIPLALCCPERQFQLIDSNGKKIRFVRNAIRTLSLSNVEAVQSRLEALPVADCRVDITCRALAPLHQLVAWVAPQLAAGSRLLAMKAELSDTERNGVPDDYNVRIESIATAGEAGLDQPARCLVIIRQSAP